MQSSRFSLRSVARRFPLSFVLVLLLTLALAACGGNPNTNPVQQTNSPGQSPTTSSSSGDQNSSSSDSQNSSSSSSSQPVTSDIPSDAHIIGGVQNIPGWQWCTAKLNGHPCASGLGNATSSMTPNQADPSLSGKSAKFDIGGKTKYSNALWWVSLGHDRTSTHFVYELDFYMKDPSAPEALEFDVNQSFDGVRYTWGTECSYRDSGHWDIWDPKAEKWDTSSAPCPQVEAKAWHHLKWDFERVNQQVHYISVTLDGNVMPVDKYYDLQKGWKGGDVNVAFQMDGNYRQTPYSVWLDNVTLTSW